MGLKERLNKWREKRRKPFRIPSYKAKKIGNVVFWVLFLWMFTVSITGLITNRVFLPIPPKRGNKDSDTSFFQGVFSC
ncbi:hypothetical protein BK755_14340 [Bacillus thuringiensis serovar aizawai]|nr:hypothetical protein BK755_14340 [Bacillus thuringiensis serovar aizawai]